MFTNDDKVKICKHCKEKEVALVWDKNANYKVPGQFCIKCKERNQKASIKKKYIKRIKDFINNLKSKPCVDCEGTFGYYAMDFDHVGPKKHFNVSRAANINVSKCRILHEIKNCDLVCSNCHRKRTHLRKQGLLITDIRTEPPFEHIPGCRCRLVYKKNPENYSQKSYTYGRPR